MTASTFYRDLPSFSRFVDLTDSSSYRHVPDDWNVIITDVKGSTKAIEAGRYKDVNTVGVATIVAAQNAMERTEFPYVFGGDGATLLVPPEKTAAVCAALDGIRSLSRDQFDLSLRVGMISVAEVVRLGGVIEVAKFALAGKKFISIFRGGGLTVAEKGIKGNETEYEIPSDPANKGDLTGLSCRWQPIPNEKGTVLSVLVVARVEDDDALYREVLEDFETILSGDVLAHNPVHISNMTYRSVRQAVREQARYQASRFGLRWLSSLFGAFISVLIFRFKIPLLKNADAYTASIAAHSDFRKFDDMLRMVIDCSLEQAEAIRSLLGGRYQAGDLFYGTHESRAALMTCFVYDTVEGGHVHFIDGGDGGYAMAAKQFKAQMKLV